MSSHMQAPQQDRKCPAWLPAILCVLIAVSPITAAAAERTLFAFNPLPNIGEQATGSHPDGTLLRDASGALYGAAMLSGKYYNGTIFKLTPPAPGRTSWTTSSRSARDSPNDAPSFARQEWENWPVGRRRRTTNSTIRYTARQSSVGCQT